MTQIISDESLRRGLKHPAPNIGNRCPEDERSRREAQSTKSGAWTDAALKESIGAALDTGWILDCDATVKLLYGHQDGAEVSYNPVKPGRPSHQRAPGARRRSSRWQGACRQTQSAARDPTILKALAPEHRPRLVRGDNAFG